MIWGSEHEREPTELFRNEFRNEIYIYFIVLTLRFAPRLASLAQDKGNALRVEYLAEALAINKNLTTSTFSPTGLGYDHICDRVSPDLPCDFSNILMVFGYDLTTLMNMDDAGTILPTINNLDDSGMPLSIYLGGEMRIPLLGYSTQLTVISTLN